MRTYRPVELLYGAFFKLRGILMLPWFLLMFFYFDPRWENSAISWSIGAILFVLGLAMRVIAQQYLRYRLAGERRLAVTGPYQIIRNPVYVGNMAILVGLTCMSELLWIAPLVFVWAIFVYSLAIRFEELRLIERYGDEYRSYAKNVRRWLPPGQRTIARGAASHVAFGKAFAAEWQCLLLMIVPVAKEVVEQYR